MRLPGLIHDLDDALVGFRRGVSLGLELSPAEMMNQTERGLADHHGFSVHRSMSGHAPVPEKNRLFGSINKVIKDHMLGNRRGKL